MEKTYVELMMLLGIWIASFLTYLLLFFIARKDMRRYDNPSFFKTILPISLASSVGMFAAIKLLSFVVGQMGLNYFSYLFEMVGYPMAFVTALVFTMTYVESVRTPKHNQKKALELPTGTPLNEIVEKAKDYFPDAPQSQIQIFPKFGDQNTLCFLPNKIEFTEYGSVYEVRPPSYPSLQQVQDVAQKKDFMMKKTKLFFFGTELRVLIDK